MTLLPRRKKTERTRDFKPGDLVVVHGDRQKERYLTGIVIKILNHGYVKIQTNYADPNYREVKIHINDLDLLTEFLNKDLS
jgi:hypothetical protein